jgi:hypothetical protein
MTEEAALVSVRSRAVILLAKGINGWAVHRVRTHRRNLEKESQQRECDGGRYVRENRVHATPPLIVLMEASTKTCCAILPFRKCIQNEYRFLSCTRAGTRLTLFLSKRNANVYVVSLSGD